jgi:predicted metal-dependent hydrolase
MEKAVLPGTPPIEIRLRRSARTRRFALRVSRTDGAVTLSMPVWARMDEALGFARAQEGWIRRALERQPPVQMVCDGGAILFEGRWLTVATREGLRAAQVSGDRLLLPVRGTARGPQVAAFLKTAARARLAAACDLHAATLGKRFRAITLRDTRSRWGSCTADGRLMFSWRLIMAPPEVLDYVAAHEVAHLAQMNHSPEFWAEVARLCPEWRKRRDWLRAQGAQLQAFRFAAGPESAGD